MASRSPSGLSGVWSPQPLLLDQGAVAGGAPHPASPLLPVCTGFSAATSTEAGSCLPGLSPVATLPPSLLLCPCAEGPTSSCPHPPPQEVQPAPSCPASTESESSRRLQGGTFGDTDAASQGVIAVARGQGWARTPWGHQSMKGILGTPVLHGSPEPSQALGSRRSQKPGHLGGLPSRGQGSSGGRGPGRPESRLTSGEQMPRPLAPGSWCGN